MSSNGVTIIALIICLTFCTSLISQPSNIGQPPIINFTKKETRAGTQTWSIDEDNLGFTWFGNNAGLIKFDGYRWELFQMPLNTIVRSLACDTLSRRVYVGSQGEFGYFEADHQNKYNYVSLSKSLPNDQKGFTEVWHTLVTQYGVFFRTDHQVFLYQNGKTKALFSKGKSFNFLSIWGKEIVLHDSENKLYKFDGNKFVQRSVNGVFDKGKISAVLNINAQITLITTLYDGIYYETAQGFLPWKTKDDNYIKSKVIYCATALDDGKFALGTSYDGMIIIDKNREIETHLNKTNNIQNNTILSIRITNTGNVWLGLDNGIDLVHQDSYFRTFYPDGDLQGTGYAAAIFKNDLFLGTNTGLYKIPWKTFYPANENNKFSFVNNSKGQVWKIQDINGKLFLAHHDGAFIIEKNTANKIPGTSGVWKFEKFSENKIIAGHYEGLILISNGKKEWENNNIDGFSESSRIILKDKLDNFWISHPYRGIYKILKDEIVTLKTLGTKFTPKIKPSTTLSNNLYFLNNEIITTSKTEFYKINPEDNTVHLYPALNELISLSDGLKFIVEDEYANIWYGTNKETGLLMPKKQFNTNYQKFIVNDLNNRLPEGFQSVLTIDKNNAIIPTEKGFLHFDPYGYSNNAEELKLFISKIILKSPTNDKLYARTKSDIDFPHKFVLSHKQNNIEINLSVYDHPDKQLVEYSYNINGGPYSSWQKSADLLFNELSPGDYKINIKAKNQTGAESNEVILELTINAPWYQSEFALFIYFTFFIGIITLLMRFQRRKHKAEKYNILEQSKLKEEEHNKVVKQNQEEIIKLQNEKLQAEIIFKNQELTSYTYHLVSKNELISEIKKAIEKLGPKFETDKELKKQFRTIIQLTEQNTNIDADWDNFIKSFDQVHSDFFKRLTEKYPNLSSNDFKMCTYLRMNLNSKDIAALMNISIRSVETNRYRLRKKLGLAADINLTQYLLRY